MICSWASKETIMRMMQCLPKSHLEEHLVHRVQKMSSICTASKFNTCLGVNFPLGTRLSELPELVKDSQKCSLWSIQNNFLGTMVAIQWTREARRTSWRATRTRRYPRTVKWWWRADYLLTERTQPPALISNTKAIWSSIQTDREVLKCSRPDHL